MCGILKSKAMSFQSSHIRNNVSFMTLQPLAISNIVHFLPR
jgi:hypothetical protein